MHLHKYVKESKWLHDVLYQIFFLLQLFFAFISFLVVSVARKQAVLKPALFPFLDQIICLLTSSSGFLL